MKPGDKVIVRHSEWIGGTTYYTGIIEKWMPSTVKIQGHRTRYGHDDVAPFDQGIVDRLESAHETIKEMKSQISDVQRRQRQMWDEARRGQG